VRYSLFILDYISELTYYIRLNNWAYVSTPDGIVQKIESVSAAKNWHPKDYNMFLAHKVDYLPKDVIDSANGFQNKGLFWLPDRP
jgi:hypothetical protein